MIDLVSNGFLVSASFGIIGGTLRSLIDLTKFSSIKARSQRMQLRGTLFYFLSVIIIGGFMGIVLDYGWALSVLGGYAGQDILDILYRSVSKVKVNNKQ